MADVIGLRVRDRTTGLVTVEITDRLTRVIGFFDSGGANSSINVPAFAMGAGWAAVMEYQPAGQSQTNLYSYPVVLISGTTLSWSFPDYQGQSNTRVSCGIIYGVY